jgi:hypothetical protein
MNYNTNLQNNNAELQEILDTINALPEASNGTELPKLNNPASVNEVFQNKEIINENGEVRVGTFTLESELTEQDNLIAQLQSAVNNLPNAGVSVETCTVQITCHFLFDAPIIYYLDENLNSQVLEVVVDASQSIRVAKNSIIYTNYGVEISDSTLALDNEYPHVIGPVQSDFSILFSS